jgi:hypothetical protein
MTKALPAALLVILATAAAAHADIRITVSRFENNQFRIEGETAPNRTVTIDGKFKVKSDGGGYFTFKREGYKPSGCMSDIKTDEDVYSAVIAGCYGEIRIEREMPTEPAPPTLPK